MFDVHKISKNRLDIRLSGQLDASAMRKGLNDLEAKSDGMIGATMLYTIADFTMPTLGAIGLEFGHLPTLFGLFKKFNKCAIVSDAAWIRGAAIIEGGLIPGTAIRAYTSDQIEDAEMWLAEKE